MMGELIGGLVCFFFVAVAIFYWEISLPIVAVIIIVELMARQNKSAEKAVR